MLVMVIRDLSGADEDTVRLISHLLDGGAQVAATRRFLADPGHHLLVAYESGSAVGFVTGVEMTHPDQGTEMFLYELGVDVGVRRKGIGTALVAALAERARALGCYGMWVAAMRAYEAAGGTDPEEQTMLSWTFDHT
jgi:ribosomal protein S18 acetylase RimI-like enzyme